MTICCRRLYFFSLIGILNVILFVDRRSERCELKIHRDHDVITVNILLSKKLVSKSQKVHKAGDHTFSGGGCYIYSCDELQDIENEDLTVMLHQSLNFSYNEKVIFNA